MRIVSIVVALLSLGAVGCNAPTNTSGAAEPVARAASQPPASQPYGTLAQMMRGIPFPNSNIIFDAQAQDVSRVVGLSLAAMAPTVGVALAWR